MPRLILFVPCRQIIVSADDQTITLVSLVDGVNAPVTDGAPQGVADITWEHLTVWQAEPDDGGQEFEQRLEIVRPDRKVAAEVRQRFAIGERSLRVRGAVVGFPSEVAGDYTLRLSLRHVLDSETWERVTEYPVVVRHVAPEPTAASSEPVPPPPPASPTRRRRASPGTRAPTRRRSQ
ncbi:MAG: hypothetical protein FJX72_14800 [Armatimonadetes bacterium]|nr:hypothetical protein [Armatimonadota bacterium]